MNLSWPDSWRHAGRGQPRWARYGVGGGSGGGKNPVLALARVHWEVARKKRIRHNLNGEMATKRAYI